MGFCLLLKHTTPVHTTPLHAVAVCFWVACSADMDCCSHKGFVFELHPTMTIHASTTLSEPGQCDADRKVHCRH